MSISSYKDKYLEWCNSEYVDCITKEELKNICNDDKEIKERFHKDLSFGTGGLRGILGAGSNRMNKYTVTKATQGLAKYVKKYNAQQKGVVIAYDSRRMSSEFAEETALCLNANGIKTYKFSSLRPTPELSYAVRTLRCFCGVVITASHNPAEYNGYKVYGEDGSQITDTVAKEILAEINTVNSFEEVKSTTKEQSLEAGLYHIVDEEVDSSYIEEIKKLILSSKAIQNVGKDLKIVYTPLHGTGNVPIRRILKELGFSNLYVVKEQEEPDGDFSTVKSPNPEDPKAFELALKLAKETDADIVLATDPDADRIGLYAKDDVTGEYHVFTGNMSGILLAEYQLSRKRELGLLPENPKDGVLLKTIVSSNMAEEIVKEYGISLIEVLTGFKYIGEQMKFFDEARERNGGQLSAEKGAYEYLFGYEESYGCLIGTHARDKDGCAAVVALCEAAAYYKEKGISLWQQMLNIYEKYGYYQEYQISVKLPGIEGAERIKQILSELRQNGLKEIGPYKVIKFRDYLNREIQEIATGIKSPINLPKSNVLYYELEKNAWLCVRPSGTEPKVKLYFGVKGKSMEDAGEQAKLLEQAAKKLLQ